MATLNEEGEARNGRLQLFFSSILSSLGGVFGQINLQVEEEEDEDLDMASRAGLQEQQPRGSKKITSFFAGFFELSLVYSWVLCFGSSLIAFQETFCVSVFGFLRDFVGFVHWFE